MKTIFKISILFIAILFIGSSCDGNDDVQSSPQDGFTVSNTFYPTENAYVGIDQSDRDNNGKADFYTFFFTDGRITTSFGEVGIGYGYAYSTNTTKLVKLQVFEGASNPNLTNTLMVGETYVASSVLTTVINGMGVTNTGFSKDSFVSYNLQVASPSFGTENGFDFQQIPEAIGIWHYAGTVGPTITINAINIDTATPTNSTIDVDYTFLDTNGNTITGHYEGTLGIIKG